MSKHPPYDLPKCLDCHRAGQKSCIPMDRAWPGVRCDRCVTNGLPCSEPVYSRSGSQHQPQLNSPPSGGLAKGGVKRGGSPQKAAASVPMPFSQQVHDDDDDWRPTSNSNAPQGIKPRGDTGFGGRLPPATASQFQHQPHRNLSMDDISISDDSRVGIDDTRDSGNERRKHRHKRRDRDREHRSSMDDFRNAGHGINVNRDSWSQNPMGSAGGGSQRGGSQRGGGGSGAGTPTRQRPGPGMGVTFDTTPTQVAPLQPHHNVRNSGARKANNQQEISTPRDSRTSQDIVRPHNQQQQHQPQDSTPDKASRRVSAPPPSSYKDPDDQNSGHLEQLHHGDTTPTQTEKPQLPPPERQSTERRSSSKISRLLPWMKGSHSSPDNSPSKDKDKDSKDQKHIHHHDPNKPSRTESQSGPHNQQPAQLPLSLPKLQSEESSLRSQPTNAAQQQNQKPLGRQTSRAQQQEVAPLQPSQNKQQAANIMPPSNSARQQPSQQSMSHPMVYGGAIPSGMAPIHFATVTGDVNMLYTLLQLGADISTPTAAGLTCLHLAVAHRQPSIVQALLDSGADPNRRAPDGMTPLLLAISPQGGAGVGGDMDARKTCIRILGARGADPNTREQGTGRTALHVAVEGREHGIVEALLGLRPDVDAVDPKGMSALHEAVTRGDIDMVKILAGAGGADLNALVERVDDDEMF